MADPVVPESFTSTQESFLTIFLKILEGFQLHRLSLSLIRVIVHKSTAQTLFCCFEIVKNGVIDKLRLISEPDLDRMNLKRQQSRMQLRANHQ
jgi:hypothetical protein